MSRHAEFWNEEYKTGEHLALSTEASEDLEKFVRFVERNAAENPLAKKYGGRVPFVLDLGTGNGRNLIALSREFGVRGAGFDISSEAISQAQKAAEGLPLTFEVRSIAETISAPDESADLVLDMMTSHFLREKEREALRAEMLRVLRPAGWLFFKTFLAESDLHVKRLLEEHPADEANTYIHPKIGVPEYVWTEERIRAFFEPDFIVHKLDKSHKHIARGKAWKRRTVSVYLEKKW